jgi:hypothetical protein
MSSAITAVRWICCFACLLLFADRVGTQSISDIANRIANDISVKILNFGDTVLFADELQTLWDRDAVLHPNSPLIIPSTIASEQAALVEKLVVLNHLEPLRKLHAAAVDVATLALSASAAAVVAAAAGDAAAAAAATDADLLRAQGRLAEASLDSDVAALAPAPDARFAADVSAAASVISLPQHCARLGVPAFGAAFAAGHTGDSAYALLGGMAPLDGGGKYECATTAGTRRQASLDPAAPIYCLSRCAAAPALAALSPAVCIFFIGQRWGWGGNIAKLIKFRVEQGK